MEKDISQNTKYQIFIRWNAKPKEERKQKTLSQFMQTFECTPEEIRAFKDYEFFGEDIKQATIEWAKEQTPTLIHTIYQKIKDKKATNDMKIWMDLIYATDKHETTNNTVINFNATMTDEQRQQIAERLLSRTVQLTPPDEKEN